MNASARTTNPPPRIPAPRRPSLVVEIHELADLDALQVWAREQGVEEEYAGPALDGLALYMATSGAQIRVARTAEEDDHLLTQPLVWRSPLATPGRETERW